MEKIKEALNDSLKEMGLFVYEINYKNKQLNIILDSDDVIDIDRIVKATKIINPILDKNDFIKENYILDVSSREKGGN